MTVTYIHQLADWSRFTWDSEVVAGPLSKARLHQGLLLGKLQGYGFSSRWEATLKVLTEETITSSAIEGIVLNPENVRSSLARRLGLDVAGLKEHADRNVEGVVEMMLDATQKYNQPLTAERLFDWHARLFPGVRRSLDKIRVGAWRQDPMQVVSGPSGREKVHYEAPAADLVEKEMRGFLRRIDSKEQSDPLLK